MAQDVGNGLRRGPDLAGPYHLSNVGHAIGPLIGAVAGLSGSAKPFLITASVYFIYPIVLQILLKRFGIKKIKAEESGAVTITKALKVFMKDRSLKWFVLGGVFSVTVHGQMSVTLSQHLERNMPDAVLLFSVLLSVNSLVVILGQIPLNRWLEKKGPFIGIVWGVFYLH
jgi:hypothetical protein